MKMEMGGWEYKSYKEEKDSSALEVLTSWGEERMARKRGSSNREWGPWGGGTRQGGHTQDSGP